MTDPVEALIEKLYEPCKRWKRCKDARYEAVDAIERLQRALKMALDSADQMKACWNAACNDIAERDDRLAAKDAQIAALRELADNLLEDLELHGLHDKPDWNYRRQKAEFKRIDAAIAAKEGA